MHIFIHIYIAGHREDVMKKFFSRSTPLRRAPWSICQDSSKRGAVETGCSDL